MMPQVRAFSGKQAIVQMAAKELEIIVGKAFAELATVTDWQVTLLGGLDSSPDAKI